MSEKQDLINKENGIGSFSYNKKKGLQETELIHYSQETDIIIHYVTLHYNIKESKIEV